MKAQVIKTQTWVITQETLDNGTVIMKRTNDGFSVIELLGMTEYISMELRDQLKGDVTPDIIKREVVEPKRNEQ